MTRKIWAIGLAVSIVMFGVLQILVGSHGIPYLVSLHQEVSDLRYEAKRKELQVEALKEQEANSLQGEGVEDAAFRLGYQQEGEQVYFFDKEEVPELPPAAIEAKPSYHAFSLSWWMNLAIALAVGLLVVVGLSLRSRGSDDE